MAQPIQTPGVGAALQRLFRLQGRVRPSLEEFVIPTVQVADLSQGSVPPVRRHAVSFFNQPGVAGQSATWRLEVPPSVLARIDRIYVTPAAAGPMFANFGSTIAVPAGNAANEFSDARVRANGELPAGLVTFGTQVAILAGTWRVDVAANEVTEIRPRAWLIGGLFDAFDFLEMQFFQANTAVTVAMEWEEYQIF